jgi:hypothetical protein
MLALSYRRSLYVIWKAVPHKKKGPPYMSGAVIPDRRTERCGDLFTVRCPPNLREALQLACERELISASAYVRGALLRRLREDGIELPDQQPAR